MRENIGLYRGKRIDNSEWVEGYYEPPIEFDGHKFGMTISYIGNRGWLEDAEIDPETVGECSGVPDKNGKLIFEGDIIKTVKYGKDDGTGRNFSGADCFCVEFFDGGYHLVNEWRCFNLRPDVNMECIGNIYDNPELLGGDTR